MLLDTFPTGPLGCNCSILVDPASKAAVVVDPGGDFDTIRDKLERAGAMRVFDDPADILLHLDELAPRTRDS